MLIVSDIQYEELGSDNDESPLLVYNSRSCKLLQADVLGSLGIDGNEDDSTPKVKQ